MVQNSVSVKGSLVVKLYAESKVEFNKVSMGLSCSSNSFKFNKPKKSLVVISYLFEHDAIRKYKLDTDWFSVQK